MATVSVTMATTATLVASTADTIRFVGLPPSAGHAPRAKVEIVNLSTTSTDVIWARWDGTTATVAGADCFPIPANSSWSPPATVAALTLISSGTPQYCVSIVTS